MAAADPSPGRSPDLVVKEPFRSPWKDGLRKRHPWVPLAWHVEAEPVALVDVREHLPMARIEGRVENLYAGGIAGLVFELDGIGGAESRRLE
jgi:hypothetical protein